MFTGKKAALGQSLYACDTGIAECIPNSLASYEQVQTTPRPFPLFGSAPTTTGSPLNYGLSLSSTDAKNASIST
jgi:hypothetical protein